MGAYPTLCSGVCVVLRLLHFFSNLIGSRALIEVSSHTLMGGGAVKSVTNDDTPFVNLRHFRQFGPPASPKNPANSLKCGVAANWYVNCCGRVPPQHCLGSALNGDV